MEGKAVAHGAVTIVSAFATGYGAALGVDTWTKARVVLTEEPGVIEGKVLSDASEDDRLIRAVVKRVLAKFSLEGKFGAKVETDSNIPIAKGLKSNSAASNAIALATLEALDKHVDDLSAINLGVDASLDAGVTVTGAFDDACASYYGGAVLTSNYERKILKKTDVRGDLVVLIHVPKEKSYTTAVNVEKLKPYENLLSLAFDRALRGDLWSPLILNGMINSIAFGYNPKTAFHAIDLGAIAAGLTGKGPALAAIVTPDKADAVRSFLSQIEGGLIESKINHERAHVID